MIEDPLAIAEEVLRLDAAAEIYTNEEADFLIGATMQLARVVKRLVGENARLHELLANDTRRAVLSFKERAEIAEAEAIEAGRRQAAETVRAEKADTEVSQLRAEYAHANQLLATAGALQDISSRIIEEKDGEMHRAEARLRSAEALVRFLYHLFVSMEGAVSELRAALTDVVDSGLLENKSGWALRLSVRRRDEITALARYDEEVGR